MFKIATSIAPLVSGLFSGAQNPLGLPNSQLKSLPEVGRSYFQQVAEKLRSDSFNLSPFMAQIYKSAENINLPLNPQSAGFSAETFVSAVSHFSPASLLVISAVTLASLYTAYDLWYDMKIVKKYFPELAKDKSEHPLFKNDILIKAARCVDKAMKANPEKRKKMIDDYIFNYVDEVKWKDAGTYNDALRFGYLAYAIEQLAYLSPKSFDETMIRSLEKIFEKRKTRPTCGLYILRAIENLRLDGRVISVQAISDSQPEIIH